VRSTRTRPANEFGRCNHIPCQQKEHEIRSVDFIKIDIQGAELDMFQGGINTRRKVVAIVGEVAFIPLYLDQPFSGGVCSFLTEQGMMFPNF
jgi:hypothetical protein